MRKLTLLLWLVAAPAFAAEPPDWYSHLAPETRAALLAARDVQRGHAALPALGVHGYRGPASEQPARYTAVRHFDASALVHPPQYSTLYRLVMQDRERALLRAYRTPDVEFGRWRRVGKHDRL